LDYLSTEIIASNGHSRKKQCEMLAIEFTKVRAAVCTQGIFCRASKYKE